MIAVLDRSDAHNTAATELLEEHAATRFVIHPVTRAEALVGAVRHNRLNEAERAIRALGVIQGQPDDDEPVLVAELRLGTGLKLPDCYVLSLALQLTAPIATFDSRLAAIAATRSIGVVR